MNQALSSNERWQDCPPGELQRILETIKIRRRRRALRQLGGAGAAIALMGIFGYNAINWTSLPQEKRYGGLACSEVMELLPDYQARRLSAKLSRQVTIHLRQCPDCGPRFRSAGGSLLL